MIIINTIHFLVNILLLFASTTSAFWLNWGGQDTANQPQYYYYQQRLLQPPYPVNGKEPPVPTIPIQVPLQAQLTPSTTVQNVQLVPCLCPVTQEFDIDKATVQENSFYNQQKQ